VRLKSRGVVGLGGLEPRNSSTAPASQRVGYLRAVGQAAIRIPVWFSHITDPSAESGKAAPGANRPRGFDGPDVNALGATKDM
jgi:hypothetical protein